jgi:hypothetical protein
MCEGASVLPHPPFGHLLPQEAREKADEYAFSLPFWWEKVAEGRKSTLPLNPRQQLIGLQPRHMVKNRCRHHQFISAGFIDEVLQLDAQ